MKQQSLTISIPEPCHEDWSKMTPTEKGRHCASCNKTVTDFTKMSKVGIVNHINKTVEEELCGRFNSDQLGVNILPARRNRLFSKWAAVFIGLIPFAGYGQTPVHTSELIEQNIKGKRVLNYNSNKEPKPALHDNNLKGKLIDAETKEPILFGTVAVLKNGVVVSGAETDINGNFSIDITDIDEVEFSYIGYQPIKKTIAELNKSRESSLIFEIKMQGYLLGDIEVVAYKKTVIKGGMTGMYSTISENESWIKRQWKKFKKLITTSHDSAITNREITRANQISDTIESPKEVSEITTSIVKEILPKDSKVINIYPNPSAGLITIDISKDLSDAHLQITDSNNQLIFSSKMDGIEYQYDATNLLTGSYIISIISKDELIASKVFIKI